MDASAGLRATVLQRLRELDRDQAWLARQVGRKQYAIHRWLNGYPFSDEDRRLVSVALGKPADWLKATPAPTEAAAAGRAAA